MHNNIYRFIDMDSNIVICTDGSPPALEKKRSIESDCSLGGEVKVAKMGVDDGQSVRETEEAPSGAGEEMGGKQIPLRPHNLVKSILPS